MLAQVCESVVNIHKFMLMLMLMIQFTCCVAIESLAGIWPVNYQIESNLIEAISSAALKRARQAMTLASDIYMYTDTGHKFGSNDFCNMHAS